MKWLERLTRRSKPESAEDLRRIQADTLRNTGQREERERQEFRDKGETERSEHVRLAQQRNASLLLAHRATLFEDLRAAAQRGQNYITINIEADGWRLPTKDEVVSLPEFKQLQSLCASHGFTMEFKVQHTAARSRPVVGDCTPAYNTTYLEIRY